MKGYSYQKSCRKIGAYHAAHLRDLMCDGAMAKTYDSDNPLTRLQVDVPVHDLEKLSEAITGAWVETNFGLLLYGRESALTSVADVADEFGKIDGEQAARAFNNEFGGYYSEEMQRRAAAVYARVSNINKLLHLVAGEHPPLRNWDHNTEAEIVLYEQAAGYRYGDFRKSIWRREQRDAT